MPGPAGLGLLGGHHPTVVGSPDFAELAASYGTEFEPWLRQEDGIGRTAELFTDYLRTAPARMAR